ncbi:MAG TPA: GNAT family N-acetyltransferase [Gammaproteobacteria bacterium]|nr:GNAT family N-acetyltransferase [Gammaproteobacteria bacterium]
MATLELCRHPDALAFLERAESWLLEEEIERAVPLKAARQAQAHPSSFEEPTYWATFEESGRIVGCSIRTPPHHVFVTRLPAAAVPLLLESLKETYTVMSGISGAEPTASALAAVSFANRWRVGSRQWLWSIAAVDPPAGPGGALRLATADDMTTVWQWGTRDSEMPFADPLFAAALMRAQGLYVWDDGTLRCIAGVLRQTRSSAALGVIYTPPDWRNKGYATATVAAWSRQVLEGGKRCFFYTNAAFAATTAICRKLGHELVHESVDIEFR